MDNISCLRCGHIFTISLPKIKCWVCGSNRWNITWQDAFEEKFWSYIDKNGPLPAHCPELGPCWTWIGPIRNQFGYGAITRNGKHYLATHIALEIVDGVDVPSGMIALHRCDNPLCVNVDHLEIGTQAQNVLDMMTKGRGRRSWRFTDLHSDVRKIRELHKNGTSTKELSEQYSLHISNIQRIVYRRSYAYIE